MPPTIQRGDGVAFPATTRAVNATTIDVLDNEGHRMGYVTSISVTSTRGLTKVRHLSSLDAGRVLETALGVEDSTLTLTGFALYDRSPTKRGSLINRMGSAFAALKSLQGQREPFHMIHREVHPSTNEVTTRKYIGCYFQSFTMARRIDQVLQTDTLTCSVEVID